MLTLSSHIVVHCRRADFLTKKINSEYFVNIDLRKIVYNFHASFHVKWTVLSRQLCLGKSHGKCKPDNYQIPPASLCETIEFVCIDVNWIYAKINRLWKWRLVLYSIKLRAKIDQFKIMSIASSDTGQTNWFFAYITCVHCPSISSYQ